MSGGFAKQLNYLTRGLLYAFVALLPLWVLPIPMEPLELNKQTLLMGMAALATLTWLAEMVIRKQVRLRKGWINALPVLWVAGFFIPAVYSVAPYTSWFGSERQEYMSVLTAIGAALVMYLLANIHDTRTRHKHMHSVLLYSTALVSILAMLEVLGVNLLSSITIALSYNTVGTLSSLTAWLLVMNSFFLTSWIAHKKGDSLMSDGAMGGIEQLLTLFVTAASFFFLLVVDDPHLWMMSCVTILVIFALSLFKIQHLSMKGKLILPAMLLIGSVLFWFWLPGISLDLPLEVTPNNRLSLEIAEDTLQHYSSSYGSGPGTYALDYGQFRGTSLNETDFWNTRFDRASNYFFTLLPTTGLFGITALAVFILLLGARSLMQVVKPQSREEWLETFSYLVPWIAFVASAFFVNWNMTLVGTFAIFSGLLASQVLDMEAIGNVKQTATRTLILTSLTVFLSLALLVGIFLTGQRYAAQLAFAQGVELDRSGASMEEVVEELNRAATLNKYNDVFYRNLAEAVVYRLDEVTEEVEDVSQLSIETTQYLQALAASAVNAAVHATDLSPEQVFNWSSRGFVYQELAPVLGIDAAIFAIQSFEQAAQLEPANPEHLVDVAKARIMLWEMYQPLIASNTELQATADELLAQVMVELEQAIDLKSDYAPAHFQMALNYARAGELDNGIGKMESVAQYNQLDIGVHFELAMLYLQRLNEGDLQRAQEALEHTVTLAPTHSNAHWFLASIYEQLGDIPAAVHEVEVVLQLNPENELVMQRLEDLLTGNISTELHTTLE